MVSVSPVHLPLSPKELHVHEDLCKEYLICQYGSLQVEDVLKCDVLECPTTPETVSECFVFQAQSHAITAWQRL